MLARKCDRCDRAGALSYLPEYGANFCGPCAADPRGESEPQEPCVTCNGDGRIDFNAGWRGPPGVERHHWHPCPDCDGHGYTGNPKPPPDFDPLERLA